jgi:hypothetical protein
MTANRILALLVMMAAALAAPAQAQAQAQAIRAVVVGIDTYQYSETNVNGAGFKDLRGAVGDAIRFKNALRTHYKLRLDTTAPGSCPPAFAPAAPPVSITLTNSCARRDAILKALDDMIAVSQPRDTLLFFFAGHGAQFADDSKQDQASGFNGTILPHDARDPNAESAGEIFDYELKAIKERAVAKGVYFVTIFDSCNSGSATRDATLGDGRTAPPLRTAPPARPISRASDGPGGGYWVHMGAALDGQLALESGTRDGKPAGVFTSTLIDAMAAMPSATFGDLIRDVQARMISAGYTKQTPVAEGELRAILGKAPGEGASFAVSRKQGKLRMAAGSVSGITPGSTFSLFRSQADALAQGASPIALARADKVDAFATDLSLIGAAPADLPAALVAVEKMRDTGLISFAVANEMVDAPGRKAVDAALKDIAFVTKGRDPPVSITPHPDKPGHAVLRARDASIVAELGRVTDADFSERLTDPLKKVWRVQQLLLLAAGNRPDTAGIRFCVDSAIVTTGGATAANSVRGVSTDCPGGRIIPVPVNRDNLIAVENRGTRPRFIYVLGIDPRFGVSLILPASGGNDTRLAPMRPFGNPDDPVRLTMPGTYHFVTIATEEPISAAALEQQGTSARGTPACSSALEQLLCNASAGTRDPKAPRTGDWNAIVTSVVVK